MSDTKTDSKPRKRKRNRQTYQYKANAVSVTVYHPMGDTIPAAIRREIEDSVFAVASENGLLINIATT